MGRKDMREVRDGEVGEEGGKRWGGRRRGR